MCIEMLLTRLLVRSRHSSGSNSSSSSSSRQSNFLLSERSSMTGEGSAGSKRLNASSVMEQPERFKDSSLRQLIKMPRRPCVETPPQELRSNCFKLGEKGECCIRSSTASSIVQPWQFSSSKEVQVLKLDNNKLLKVPSGPP